MNLKIKVELVSEKLHNKTGAGNDFLGWLDLPVNYDKEEFAKIKKASEKIKSDSEVLVVIGIGGSYLGARAVIECLSHSFFNSLSKEKEMLLKSICRTKYIRDLFKRFNRNYWR